MSPLALSLRFLQTQPDARLAELARNGHERAFEALVHRYHRQLLAYSRRLVGPTGSAEDVLQQALMQAWVAIDRGVEVTEPRAWLYRIVHNAAISHLRQSVETVTSPEDTPAGLQTDNQAEQRIEAHTVLASLAALPPLQREVMLGAAIDGRSHEELASALGLSSGAVRGLIYRARATLRAAAAAITPAPIIRWAARAAAGRPGHAAAAVEAVAGSSSVGVGAGMGGILLKAAAAVVGAGAVVTAGFTATRTVSATHHSRPAASTIARRSTTAAASPRTTTTPGGPSAPPSTATLSASLALPTQITRVHTGRLRAHPNRGLAPGSPGGSARTGSRTSVAPAAGGQGGFQAPAPTGSRNTPATPAGRTGAGGSDTHSPGDGSSSTSGGSGTGGSGSSGGHDGGGTSEGSRSGSDGGTATTNSGSSQSSSVGSGGSDGGSSAGTTSVSGGGSDGGGSIGAATSSGGSDGGSSSGATTISSGGSDGGGTTTNSGGASGSGDSSGGETSTTTTSGSGGSDGGNALPSGTS